MDYERAISPKHPVHVHHSSHLWDIFNLKTAIFSLMTVAVAYLSLVPVITLITASLQSDFLEVDSVWTLSNFVEAFLNPAFYRSLSNSVIFAVCSTALAMCIGVSIAWLHARTNTPFKALVLVTALVPFIIPGILNAVAWIFLLSPSIGIVNLVCETFFGSKPFNIYSMGGMVFVEAIHDAPLAFAMALATFNSMDGSLEESALMSGAKHLKVIREITLKMAMPGFFAAALLIFIRAISGFEVPQLIGVPGNIYVFSSRIYDALHAFPTKYGIAGALGTMVLLIAVCGAFISSRITRKGNRYATITGKGFKPTLIDLGNMRWLGGAFIILTFSITVVMPIVTLAWASLLANYKVPSLELISQISLNNYSKIWEYPGILNSFKNSMILSVVTGIVTMILTAILAYITVKTKVKGRWVIDVLAFLPIAVPGIVLGVGILFWYLAAPLPFKLYGTLTILCIAFITTHIPYGIRYMTAGMVQIKDELEEAGYMSGASWQRVFFKIYVPLLIPSLLAGFVYTLITVFREISSAIFLYTQDTQIVSIVVFDLWINGNFTVTAAIGIIIILILIVMIAILQKLGSKWGINQK